MRARKPVRKAKKTPSKRRGRPRKHVVEGTMTHEDIKNLAFLLQEGMSKGRTQGVDIPKIRIERQTDLQLQRAIDQAARVYPDFWVMVYGIHAFFEQRRRKQKARRLQVELDPLDFDDRMWGQD